jgi:hypothetical protein
MKTLAILALLASTTATVAAACIVPEIIFETLKGPLTVTLESEGASIPGVDGKTLEYQRQLLGPGGNGGVVPPRARSLFGLRYLPGIDQRGALSESSNLTAGAWILEESGSQAYVIPPLDKPRFRRVAFSSNPAAKDALKVRAGFSCGKDNKARLVIVPQDGLEFCVHIDNNGDHGEYGLWVQPTGQGEATCCFVF